MRYSLRSISFLLIFSFISSCAGWRVEKSRPVNEFPTDLALKGDDKKPNISLKIKKYEFYDNEELDKEESSETERKKAYALIEEAYKKSGYVNLVSEDSPSREMSVEIELVRKNNTSMKLAVLSAITLFLVPRRSGEEITLTTRFFNKKGELVGMVEKVDEVVTWWQTLMIFASPFMYPGSAKKETLIDLNRATLIEAKSDGYFIDINS